MTDAVLITGGIGSSTTAELYVPSSGLSCPRPGRLARLPHRYFHSVESSGLLCGGRDTEDTCLQWRPDNGTWEEALTLSVGRQLHVSWTPGDGSGTYLMGGKDSENWRTTTLIKPDRTQEPGFPLRYDT